MTVVQELTALDNGVERAAERLLALQHPDGWWKGELESNATMIAEHLFLLHFLGLRDAETDRLLANELLTRRRADGTWSIWFEGPADLSVTVEAYAALKLAGVDAGDATRQYIRRSGGVARTRIFTRAFLALIGQWPWRRLAHVPVELILLPPAGPLSVYDFACWARQTMVSLSVVEALRPVRPSSIDLGEIGARKTEPDGRPHLTRVRRCKLPAGGCSARRSPLGATGRSVALTSLPAAGRSSSTTISIPTSTTRRSSFWRYGSWESAMARFAAGSTGWSGCSPAAAAGARSTSTMRRSGSTSSRSATSAR